MKRKKTRKTKRKDDVLPTEYTVVKGKYGDYSRKRVKAKDPKTVIQKKVRSSFADLAAVYSSLTEKEALTWELAARNGSIRKIVTKKNNITAQILFNTLNRNRQEIGEAIIRTAPVITSALYIGLVEISITDGKNGKDMVMSILPEIDAETKVIIYATAPVRNSILSPNINDYKKIHVIDSTFKSGDSIIEPYLNKYKVMPKEGEKIVFLVKPVNKNCGTVNVPYKVSSQSNPNKIN